MSRFNLDKGLKPLSLHFNPPDYEGLGEGPIEPPSDSEEMEKRLGWLEEDIEILILEIKKLHTSRKRLEDDIELALAAIIELRGDDDDGKL